ncbi:hypothetical protein [Candidatus Villigracilis saccharophilus]|uniref:hypothetical protein n=1 Tax=Candidatus Villigracilis saccharophilus TaxID=3140684 RepID=UPI0031364958|nr:hypothetical protein [Anaerolineales bacterium]
MNEFVEVLSIFGHFIRALGFIALGFGVGRFTMDAYKKAVWQVQIALIFGFFGMLVGLTHYASAGSMGMFALSTGAAMILPNMPKKEDTERESKE